MASLDFHKHSLCVGDTVIIVAEIAKTDGAVVDVQIGGQTISIDAAKTVLRTSAK